MKKIITIALMALSLSADVLSTRNSDVIQSSSSFAGDYQLVTFCRNGLQWVMVRGSQRSGLSLDYQLVDKNNPSKGAKVIPCLNY